MRLKSIVNGNNRQFIRITDVDLLETIERLLPYYDSFNALANDALEHGLPLLLAEKTNKEITLGDEPEFGKEETDKPRRRGESLPDPRIDEVIRLLSELIINSTLDKAMLSGLFNAKIKELEDKPILADRLSRGLLNDTPNCLYATEIDMLKELNEDEEDE